MPQQGSKGRDALATLTLTTHDTVANGDKNQKGNASRGVREGGIRITLDRDEGMDLLGDLGDLGQLFDVSHPCFRRNPAQKAHSIIHREEWI